MQGVSVLNLKLDKGRPVGSLLVVISKVLSELFSFILTDVMGQSFNAIEQIVYYGVSRAVSPPQGIVPDGHL